MKQTPKSCSCAACKRGKGTCAGKATLQGAERAYRRKAKAALAKGAEDIAPAPRAGRTD